MGKKIKILVVEDDQLLKNILSVKLVQGDFEPVFVSNGLEVIKVAEDFHPDVILLDLMLPGQDGFEVLETLKRHVQLRDIPVMVFSNKGEDSDKSRALELGAALYMVKAHSDLGEVMTDLHKLVDKS